MENKRICSSCHAACAPDARFCGMCGIAFPERAPVVEDAPSKCPICGSDVEPGMRFCGACGTMLIAEQPEVVSRVCRPKKKEKVLKREKLHVYLRSGLLLLVAALMLGFAFLPVYRIELYYDDGAVYGGNLGFEPRSTITQSGNNEASANSLPPEGEVNFTISAIDTIVLFIDSIYNQKDPMDENPRLYRRLGTAFYSLAMINETQIKRDGLDVLSEPLQEYVFLAIRLSARDTSVDPTVMMGATAVLSIAYLSLALVAFILSLLSFLNTMGVLRGRSRFRGAVSTLLALPLLLLVLNTIAGFAFTGLPTFYAEMIDTGVTVDTGFYSVNLYLGFGVAVALLVERIVFARKQISFRRMTCVAIAFALCLTSLLLLRAPMMNADVFGAFDTVTDGGTYYMQEATAPIDGGYFNKLHADFGALRTSYSAMGRTATSRGNYFQRCLEDCFDYTVEMVENGLGDTTSHNAMNAALVAQIKAKPAFFIGLVGSGIIVAMALLLMVALHRALVEITMGLKARRPGFVYRLVATVLATLLLALIIVTVALINDRIDGFNLSRAVFTLRIAATPILISVFMLGSLFVPRGVRRVVRYVDDSAEGADPSDEGEKRTEDFPLAAEGAADDSV